MNVAAYARVSTQRQTEEQTITQQIDRLHAKAQAESWTMTPDHLYCDDGYSGARIDRPALDRLRDAAARGEFQAVLVTAPDRLARRFVHQTLLVEELAQGGCTIVFLDRPISQDPNDQLLLQIRGAVAEYERALIADRTRRGRLAKLRTGQLLPWINTPYGYRCDPQHPRDPARLRIEDTEASVIRQLFTWYADEGLSIHAIAARLLQRQIPTYHGGWHWAPVTVGGMLRNEVYVGTAYGNRDYETEPQRWRGGRAAAEQRDADQSCGVHRAPLPQFRYRWVGKKSSTRAPPSGRPGRTARTFVRQYPVSLSLRGKCALTRNPLRIRIPPDLSISACVDSAAPAATLSPRTLVMINTHCGWNFEKTSASLTAGDSQRGGR